MGDGVSKRKFENPTQGYVGATILDDDNKPKGMPVEPGGSIWLSQAEERLTAEAPRLAENNPFTKPWKRVTEVGTSGEPIAWEDCVGVLVLSEEPARTILSDRFIPSAQETPAAVVEPEVEPERTGEQDIEETTGAPPLERQPPVEGKPSPDETVATPDAERANDEHLARHAEGDGEKPTSIGEGPPQGPERISVRKEQALV